MDALMLGLLAAVLWGLHDFTVRVIGARIDPLVLLGGVFMTGVIVLAPLTLHSDWSLLRGPDLRLAFLAGVAYTGAGYGLYRAFAIGPVYLVAPICGAFPMVSVALELTRGGSAALSTWVGAAVIVTGIALVARSTGHGEEQGNRNAAIGWALLGCFGFSFTFALSQWASENGAPLPVALVVRVTASLVVLLAIAIFRPAVAPTLRAWKPMVMMGLLDVSALTLVTLAGGMPNAEYASVAASIFGVVTILLAWRFLHERLGPVQWLGCTLVFTGIVVLGLSGHGGHG